MIKKGINFNIFCSDLEITNICHFSGFGREKKLEEFEKIREKIEKNIFEFDLIRNLEKIILNFLKFERDKTQVQTQADSLRILAAKIFNNLNTMVSITVNTMLTIC